MSELFFPSLDKEGWRAAPGWLAFSGNPPRPFGTPPLAGGEIVVPLLDKEGWRAAPGWLAWLRPQRQLLRRGHLLVE